MEDTLIFKIIGFNKFDNGIDDSDCIATLENGEKIRVDPFVSGAFKEDNFQFMCRTCNAFKANKLDKKHPKTKVILLRLLNQ